MKTVDGKRDSIRPPGLERRVGEVMKTRRGVEFQELKAESLVNRLSGSSMPFGWTVNPFRGC